MSISNWLARKGAVGGTARWAGAGYLAMKNKNPNANINQIMQALVEIRYSSASTQKVQKLLLRIIQDGEMRGLAHLVTNILNIEAGFNKNTQERRFELVGVINEELAKQGVPEGFIYNPLGNKL